MLKLVKYDFRRNRDQILAIFVITILVQLGIGLLNYTDNERFIMNVVVYIVSEVILLVYCVRTYVHNLESFQRRLLPVKTLYTVLSPLLLFLGLLMGILIIALIHFGVYIGIYTTSFLPINFWSVAVLGILQIFWSAGFLMLTVMFSITIACSVRFKGRVWIGVVMFFIIQQGLMYIELLIFDTYFSALDNAFRFGIIEESAVSSGVKLSRELFEIGPTLFEAGIAIVLLYVIVKLVNKRVES